MSGPEQKEIDQKLLQELLDANCDTDKKAAVEAKAREIEQERKRRINPVTSQQPQSGNQQ